MMLWLVIKTATAAPSFHLTCFLHGSLCNPVCLIRFYVTNQGVDQASDTVFQIKESKWIEP